MIIDIWKIVSEKSYTCQVEELAMVKQLQKLYKIFKLRLVMSSYNPALNGEDFSNISLVNTGLVELTKPLNPVVEVKHSG